ncbi:MAG: SEC-C metal-binding domain-containing protein, partial [Oscillospiraceae bacterium]
MFQEMITAIQEETIRRLFTVQLRPNAEVKRERVAKVTGESGAEDGTLKKQPVKKAGKPGRNDPCPCGSGKKYKKCCGMNDED